MSKINHPSHYNCHPSGIECIRIAEHMTFNIGNVFKYLWRSGLKEEESTENDYKKAFWYLLRECQRLNINIDDTYNDDIVTTTVITVSNEKPNKKIIINRID